jgi:hypothetical protein
MFSEPPEYELAVEDAVKATLPPLPPLDCPPEIVTAPASLPDSPAPNTVSPPLDIDDCPAANEIIPAAWPAAPVDSMVSPEDDLVDLPL